MVGTHGTYLVGQRVVGLIAVNENIAILSMWHPHLHHCVRQHCLIVIILISIGSIVPETALILLEHQLVLRHPCIQNMVGHKHVQRIVAIGVVISSADADTVLTDIIIPVGTIAINLISILNEVLKTIDTIAAHDLVRFCKDGIAHLADLLRRQFAGIVLTGNLRELVGFVLLKLQERVCQTCGLECLIEDGVVLGTVQIVASRLLLSRNDIINNMYNTVGCLMVGADDRCLVVEHGATNRVEGHLELIAQQCRHLGVRQQVDCRTDIGRQVVTNQVQTEFLGQALQ